MFLILENLCGGWGGGTLRWNSIPSKEWAGRRRWVRNTTILPVVFFPFLLNPKICDPFVF